MKTLKELFDLEERYSPVVGFRGKIVVEVAEAIASESGEEISPVRARVRSPSGKLASGRDLLGATRTHPASIVRSARAADLFDKCKRAASAGELRKAGLYPYYLPISKNLTGEVVIDGHRLIMIGSNNYLGLTHHPKVVKAAKQAVDEYGSGCTGSRVLNGTLDLHVTLEARMAHFFRREACITFSTGSQANLGVLASLVGRDDVILCDRENHASIFDACRLSFGALRKYRHNDMEDLERQLQTCPPGAGRLIVTDGVFSMRGDICDLPSIVRLARRHGARVMVDDAHGVGVLGANGRGTCEHWGLEADVDIIVGTFSKSFASLGGFAVATASVIDFVKHMARPLIFSASLTPSSTAAALAALDIIESEPERRIRLSGHVSRMRTALAEIGYDVAPSESAILPIPIGDDIDTFRFWSRLHNAGVFAIPFVSPATAPGEAMIRTSYMATHSDAQLDQVLAVLARVGHECGILGGGAESASRSPVAS